MLRTPGARRSHRPGPAAIAVLLFLGTWLAPSVASAHSFLVRTTPTTGAGPTVPDVVTLTFNEPPRGRFSVVQVTGPDGLRRDAGPVSVLNDTVTEALAGTRPAGQWTVDWRVVSSDGHPVSGRWSFTADTAAPALAAPVAAPAVAGSRQTGSGGGHLGHVLIGFGIALLLGLSYLGERLWKRRPRAVTS